MPNQFKNASLEPVPTSDTVVYTCPIATQAVVHSLQLTNFDPALSVNATIKVKDASVVQERFLGSNLPIPVGSSLTFDKPINLEPGDQIILKASDTNRLSGFLSILEIT